MSKATIKSHAAKAHATTKGRETTARETIVGEDTIEGRARASVTDTRNVGDTSKGHVASEGRDASQPRDPALPKEKGAGKQLVTVRVLGTTPVQEAGALYHPERTEPNGKGGLRRLPADTFETTAERAAALAGLVEITGKAREHPAPEHEPAAHEPARETTVHPAPGAVIKD